MIVCVRGVQSSENRCSDSWLRGGSWPGELSCERAWWTRKSSGRQLLVDFAGGETQEEHLRSFILTSTDVDDDGTSCLTASARVIHAQSSRCRRIWTGSSSTGGQQFYDSPSSERCSESHRCERPVTSEGILWRGRGFPIVVEEDGGILRWSDQGVCNDVGVGRGRDDGNLDRAHQSGISTERDEPGARSTKLEFILQQMHTMLTNLTSGEANDTVANSRKNPWSPRLQLQKRYDPTTGGRKRNFLRTIVSPRRCSLPELQAGLERWESAVSQYEKMLENEMNDEIKLAGWETLVPELLEKHRMQGRDVRGGEVRLFNFVISSRVTRVCVNAQMLRRLTLSRQSKMRVIRFACWMFEVQWSTYSTRLQDKQERWQASVRQRQSRQVMVQE